MRFLIICALLFCFQSFVVCTKEDGAVIIAQKTITKSKPNQLTSLLSKKIIPESIVESAYEFLDRIHQNIENHFFILNYLQNKDVGLVSNSMILRIRESTNHSYFYIFNCLYPKHAFW